MKHKTNLLLVETIIQIKKINPLLAKMLATPKKKAIKLNLEELNNLCKDGDKIIVPGKILGEGIINKKIRVVAWSASEEALKKMKETKTEFNTIYSFMKDIKELNNYKILK